MKSRERVLASLNHREPDRVPVDLSGHRSSGISSIAYPKLRAALGLEPRTVDVYDPLQQLAICHDDVLDRFGVDTVELGRAFCDEDKWWADWTLPDGTPCRMPVWALPEAAGAEWVMRAPSGRVIARMPEGSLHFDQVYWPFLAGSEDLSRIQNSTRSTFGRGCRRRRDLRCPGLRIWLRERGRFAPRRTGPSSGCSAEICLRWGSSTTGWTTS